MKGQLSKYDDIFNKKFFKLKDKNNKSSTVDPFPDEIVRFAKVLVTKSSGALI